LKGTVIVSIYIIGSKSVINPFEHGLACFWFLNLEKPAMNFIIVSIHNNWEVLR